MESGFTEQHGRREQRLVGCRSYFDHVLTPNANSFFNEPRTLSSTINLATSLFHFHEWLHREFEVELITKFGQNAVKPSGFWRCVEAINPVFGYVRDVTNASKHVEIGTAGPKPSTGIRTIESVMIVNRGYGIGGFGCGGYGGGPDAEVSDGDTIVDFYECAEKLLSYWSDLLREFESNSD